jgi:hypothetical protein
MATCHRCIHYFVTWDARFPHGCRAMGFKSRHYPIQDVQNAVGQSTCQLYRAKPQNPSNGRLKNPGRR